MSHRSSGLLKSAAPASGDLFAFVLAAGEGARMGGPKALLAVDGAPLAVAHARRLRQAGCEVTIVTRAEVATRLAGERLVISDAPDPAGSLGIGLRAAPPPAGTLVVITPVDAWPARLVTIEALIQAVRTGAAAATPVVGDRSGHPVVVRSEVLAGFADAPRPLRDVLAALGTERARVLVDDPGISVDLDTPDDVLRITGQPPRFV